MSYDMRDARKRTFDALVEAAALVDVTDRPVKAHWSVDGHEIWVVPAGTRLSEFLSVYSEPDPYRRKEAKRRFFLDKNPARRLGHPNLRVVEREQ